MNKARDNYLAVNKDCQAAWKASEEFLAKTMTQNDWIKANYPNWSVLKSAFDGAAQNVATLNAQINGPMAAILQDYTSKVGSALGQAPSA